MVSNIYSELLSQQSSLPIVVQVIAWITVICLIATFLLLAYTLGLRVYKNRQISRFSRFKNKWRPVLFAWMAGNESKLPRLNNSQKIMMLELWFDIRRHLDDGSADGLNRLAVKLELDIAIARILQYRKVNSQNRNVWLQTLAIKVATYMNTPIARQALVAASDSPNFLINIEATCGLVSIHHETAEYSVLATLLQFEHWVPFIASKISKAGGSEILHLIIKQLDLLNDKQSRNLISLLEYTEDKDLIPLLIETLQSTDDPEIECTILKTLGRLGDQTIKKYILPYLESRNAWLRLHAIVALGDVGSEDDLERLLPLLSDTEWWVRYRAAQVYVAAHDQDIKKLDKLIAGLSDPFAVDILNQAIAETTL